MSQFLDAAYPQSAARFLGALKAGNVAGFTFYIGGDIALNPWPKAIVDAVRAEYPGMAIHVPDLDSGDGAEAVALAREYGLPAGYKIALDIEPGIFRSKAAGMAGIFADQWCDAVRAAGYVAVLYGTVATCAACANHADFIWLTVPGQPDPNAVPLAKTFFAGRRAIQYAAVDLNGVQCDVSNSQYPLGGLAGDPAQSVTTTTTGGIDLLPDERAWLIDVHSAVARLEKVLGSAVRNADGSYAIVPDPQLPNIAGWTRDVTGELDNIEGREELIEQSPAIGAEHTTPPGP